MRNLIKFFTLWYVVLTSGCQTLDYQKGEQEAKKAAVVIKERSRLIQDAIATAVRLTIYNLKEGEDKDRGIEMANVVATNLENCLKDGTVDPVSLRAAFRINETEYDQLFQSVASLLSSEIDKSTSNGYSDVAVAFVKAAAAGVRDGTTR